MSRIGSHIDGRGESSKHCAKDVRRTISRPISNVIDESLSFFGLGSRESTIEDWNVRRLRFVIKRYGSIREDCLTSLASSPVTNEIGAFSRLPAASTSHHDPHKMNTKRQMSAFTTLSLPAYRPISGKRHALVMIASALWNFRPRTGLKKIEEAEISSRFTRYHSAPTGKVNIDTVDSHGMDKWLGFKFSKQEVTPFLGTANESRELKTSSPGSFAFPRIADDLHLSKERISTEDISVDDSCPPSARHHVEHFDSMLEDFSEKPRTLSFTRRRVSPLTLPQLPRKLTEGLRTPSKWASVIFSPHKDSFTEDIYRNKTTDFTEYRPYFTYWVTFVQLMIFLASSIGYGFAPIGLGVTSLVYGKVRLPSLTLDQVCWTEYTNMWIGPRQTDLIRLGARFPPCMRFDPALHHMVIERQKNLIVNLAVVFEMMVVVVIRHIELFVHVLYPLGFTMKQNQFIL